MKVGDKTPPEPITSEDLGFNTSPVYKDNRKRTDWLRQLCCSHLHPSKNGDHGVAQVGEKSARIPVRFRFVSVGLCASRRAVPRERPRLQGDVRPGGVCELLQSFYLQVRFRSLFRPCPCCAQSLNLDLHSSDHSVFAFSDCCLVKSEYLMAGPTPFIATC